MDQPSLPSLYTVLNWIGRRWVDLLVVLVVATLLGEIYLRTRLGRQHEYGPDPELGARFRPDQDTERGRLNADGHRGPETDWSRPMFLGLGDSQAFGSGVADEFVWTARLTQLLGVPVVNAGHPGFGPFQQMVEMRRSLAKGGSSIRGVLVRVSIEDRNFTPPDTKALPAIQADVENRGRWRAWCRVAPFLASKIGQQWPAIASLATWTTASISSRPADAKVGARMWDEQGRWWTEMADLAERAEVPLVFFVHDPTDLPSNRLLEQRLLELTRDRPLLSVTRLDSKAWGLRPGGTDQLWQQYHERYTLQHDHHGNEYHHARVAAFLAELLRGDATLQARRAAPAEHPGTVR